MEGCRIAESDTHVPTNDPLTKDALKIRKDV